MLDIKVIGENELRLYLDRTAKGIKRNIRAGLKEVSSHLQEKVKDKFGTYQANWPKLKRASVAAKYNRNGLKGFKRPNLFKKASGPMGGDMPLVLSGELEASIKKSHDWNEAKVFSDNIYSAVHEYGYGPKGVPSRSYMRLTLTQEEDEVFRIVDSNIARVL